MRILFAGNKQRGVACLKALWAGGHQVAAVLAHPSSDLHPAPGTVAAAALEMGLPLLQPADVNHPKVVASLREFAPELTLLAGYSPIVRQSFISLAPKGCLNLHGGKLPEYRGSSPMNWALINGEKEFTLSIIRVSAGVDTGDLLYERTFPIGIDDTIADLQKAADEVFPEMVLEVIAQIQKGAVRARKQEESRAAYYPLRFPDDGLILWDLFTAEQIHNRIRALTDPYPGAFTFFRGQRVKLLRSTLAKQIRYGEPGRIYLKSEKGLLVCASDKCLWIQKAAVEEEQKELSAVAERYDKLATVRDLAAANALIRDWK